MTPTEELNLRGELAHAQAVARACAAGFDTATTVAEEAMDRIRGLLVANTALVEQRRALAAALRQWKCGSCGGKAEYLNRWWEGGELKSASVPCKVCEQTGLNPLAARAIAAIFGESAPYQTVDISPASIRMSTGEALSGHDRVRWAEGLIAQLPADHDGRNSWLLNYGTSDEAVAARAHVGLQWDERTKSAFVPLTQSPLETPPAAG